ncbi:SRPBCC family protein [Streptomyces niveiscabiei]|uniref:SRPBCC family protein n=1 Tax=Streptomyces niveiscabiei TaxID=164115 RepID=UPI0029A45403|nr:SRPBCC family protein [Streptomyces niveiscabiei]MDX3385887.1 SRPBCC family protein [Streptomyces niveiscabiei]
MPRTDRSARLIPAPPATVYAALVDPAALETWLPPAGMRGHVEHWDPRPGGGFRMTLTYLDPTHAPGKTSDGTDVVDIAFTSLLPPEQIVQQAVFTSDDPSYAGTMTMTWDLTPTPEGTRVTVTATDVPSGISRPDHETAIASSLAHLETYVTGRTGD